MNDPVAAKKIHCDGIDDEIQSEKMWSIQMIHLLQRPMASGTADKTEDNPRFIARLSFCQSDRIYSSL